MRRAATTVDGDKDDFPRRQTVYPGGRIASPF
jgi:hypothetical protein